MTSVARLQWRAVSCAAAAALLTAALGATLTDMGPWYRNLHEPSWKPPDSAFGLIWTVIFSLCAVAGVLAWSRARTDSGRQWILALFALNGFLNILWSLVFFKLRRPDLALVEVGVLWVSILALIITLYRSSILASLLLVPYLVWVGVAAALNFEVVALNGPF